MSYLRAMNGLSSPLSQVRSAYNLTEKLFQLQLSSSELRYVHLVFGRRHWLLVLKLTLIFSLLQNPPGNFVDSCIERPARSHLINNSRRNIKMRARSSVHNDSQTVAEIKRKNLELINRLVKVKPVVRASD